MAPQTASSPHTARRSAATRKKERTRAIILATRALFDERGTGDAQIEDIARSVGINRAIVYRHFTGKDELFALALVTYLEDVHALLVSTGGEDDSPTHRLRALVEAFAAYGLAHPAFVDCAQTLMRRSSEELIEEMSEDAALRLGRAMAGPLTLLAGVLRQGTERGEFVVGDPEAQANFLYATALGALQLTRVGVLQEHSPGNPMVRTLSHEQATAYLVEAALALAGCRGQ